MRRATIAAVQAEPVWLDAAATTEKTVQLIEQAASRGADLVAFPELWLPGFPVFLFSQPVYEQAQMVLRYQQASISADGPELARIARAARELGIIVVVGYSERVNSTLYMSQSIIDKDGTTLVQRRKLKPSHVERSLFGESDGSGIRVAETEIARVGALNCFEHLQPLTKYAMYAQNEQLHVAAWPCLGIMGDNPSMSPSVLKAVSQSYALEGAQFVVTSSQIMSDIGADVFSSTDGSPCPIYTGGGGIAAVFGPNAAELTQPLPGDVEGIVVAEIDLAEIGLARNTVDPAGHYARPDVFQLIFDDRPKAPMRRATDADAAGSADSFTFTPQNPFDSEA